jgi:hypothetical protein
MTAAPACACCLPDKIEGGWHVETYGGGVWTSVAWYSRAADAQAHRTKLIMSGRYAGMQPRVTPG